MDEIIKIIGIGIISLIIIIIIKQYRPEFAIYVSIIAGITIIYLILNKLEGIINLLKTISSKSGINNIFIEAKNNLKRFELKKSWSDAIDNNRNKLNLKIEDINTIKSFGNMLRKNRFTGTIK